MKLVIATPLYPPEIGGPATYAKLLCEGLPGKGIEVELVKFSDIRHLPKVIRHLAYFWRVRKAAKRADAVYALDPVSVGLPASIAARMAHKPFFVKIVGDYAWEQGRQRFGIKQNLDDFVVNVRVPFMVRMLRRVQSRVARSARHIIVPSEYLKGIVAAWGISREKIKVIYNSVPAEELGTVPDAVKHLPRPVVVSVGRLVPWKGMDGVIDAVAMLRKQKIEASLVIAGDGPERVPLVAHAEEELKGGYIFAGALSHADTLALMKCADVLVLNSSYEGLSHLLIEALQVGAPIVATNVGGNPEMITDGQEGLLVPFGDAPALVEAVARVLSDEKLRLNLSMHGRESASMFSTETMLGATAEFFKKV